jgi:hypothetical protein
MRLAFRNTGLRYYLSSPPSSRYQINALTSTYGRLVEAALIDYHAGTIMLRELWGTNSSLSLGAMHRSISHFETCISNMYRATNCFRRLRRDRQQDPLSLMLNTEKASFAADSVADIFRTIRNEIHHLEEMVMEERIAEGQPFALKPDGPETTHPTELNQTIKTIDRLVIGSREVKFSELAKWLTEMSSFTVKIANFLPSSSSNVKEQSNA